MGHRLPTLPKSRLWLATFTTHSMICNLQDIEHSRFNCTVTYRDWCQQLIESCYKHSNIKSKVHKLPKWDLHFSVKGFNKEKGKHTCQGKLINLKNVKKAWKWERQKPLLTSTARWFSSASFFSAIPMLTIRAWPVENNRGVRELNIVLSSPHQHDMWTHQEVY